MRRIVAGRLWQAAMGDVQTTSSSGAALESMYRSVCGMLGGEVRGMRFETRRNMSTEGDDEERVIDNPKVIELADQIVELNMIEVSDLTELLRRRLNIQAGVGGMGFGMPAAMGAMGGGMQGGAGGASSDAPAAGAEEKTEFTIKLSGFDSASKIKVIKEVRAITDLGLKEAKELVEGAPAVIKEGLKKEDAEELKSKLEAGACIWMHV